jgi:hypothetical protein
MDAIARIKWILANEQIKQQQFYHNELDKAIDDIKRDFQTLLKNNKIVLENAYTERIEQVKTQISTIQTTRAQAVNAATPRVSIESLHEELKSVDKVREQIENEYRPLVELHISKQKEKNSIDEERLRLDAEYNRLVQEINQTTEAIEIGKQHSFSVHFELETYRRLLDLQSHSLSLIHHHGLSNGKEEIVNVKEKAQVNTKKTESQRAISKSGKCTARINDEHSFQRGPS